MFIRSGGLGTETTRSGVGIQQPQVTTITTETTSRPSASRTQRLGAKRLGSVWRHAAGEQLEQVRKALTEDFDKEESVIGKLLPSFVKFS